MSQLSLTPPKTPFSKRWFIFGAIVLVLLVVGFYTVTDPARLDHHHALDGADYAGYAICHRITLRSFTVAGRQLPLCARCTGMYLGVFLIFAVMWLSGRQRWSDLPPMRILFVLGLFVGLMGIDGINSYSHFFENAPHVYEPQNWLRLLTGLGTGMTMGIVIFSALAQTLWKNHVYKPVIGSGRELIGLILLFLIAYVLILSNQPTLLYVLAIASALGVVFIITSINTVLLLIVLRRDGFATRWQQTLAPLTMGLVFTVIQIAVVSYVRFGLTGTLTGFPGL